MKQQGDAVGNIPTYQDLLLVTTLQVLSLTPVRQHDRDSLNAMTTNTNATGWFRCRSGYNRRAS
jgi:hypothetical protein